MNRSRGRSKARAVVSTVLLVMTVAGCGASNAGPDARLPETPPSQRIGLGMTDADLWLSFDTQLVGPDGSRAYPDANDASFEGRLVAANGGTAEEAQGPPDRGPAVAFPPKCTATTGCPRAMLEVMPDPALDPGESPFAYGASVWLSADQTAAGSNILQKGRFGTAGGQWKLQVDGDEGFPSCVIRSGEKVLTVASSTSVADSRWHRVVCRRDPRGISIEVDGSVHRRSGESGSVSNSLPITIGSPGVGDHDDQFHGRLDDVFLMIEVGG